LADTDEGQKPGTEVEAPRPKRVRSVWGVGYIKRKLKERAAQKKEELPVDKAARITATATKWMAVFTFLLFLVTLGTLIILKNQLQEMRGSGTQTDKIISAANLIEDHQKQMVKDNKQVLSDNRNALADSLKENRTELAKVLQQNREALNAGAKQSKAALDATVTASNAQNKILSDQLVASNNALAVDQRPWVAVEGITIVDRWYWEPVNKAYNFTVSFTLNNTGKTPALDAWISPRVVPSAWGETTVSQNVACAPPTRRAPGFVLFANKPLTQQLQLSLTQSDIDAANLKTAYDGKPEHGMFALNKVANPAIVGCVIYYSGFYNSPLLTGFTFELRLNQRYGDPPLGAFMFIPLDHTEIPASRLIVQEGPLGGNWAR
jgi:hypothetical protein